MTTDELLEEIEAQRNLMSDVAPGARAFNLSTTNTRRAVTESAPASENAQLTIPTRSRTCGDGTNGGVVATCRRTVLARSRTLTGKVTNTRAMVTSLVTLAKNQRPTISGRPH
jgi:hypothetical protein